MTEPEINDIFHLCSHIENRPFNGTKTTCHEEARIALMPQALLSAPQPSAAYKREV